MVSGHPREEEPGFMPDSVKFEEKTRRQTETGIPTLPSPFSHLPAKGACVSSQVRKE